MRESISMAAAATARAMAVAAGRAREVVVARGGGDVRERAPHGENENGLDINK